MDDEDTDPNDTERPFTVTRAADRSADPHTPLEPTTPQHTRFAALGSRNFRLYMIGQAVTTTGLWVQRIAQDWLVLSLTGSATAVGITTALQWAPILIFGLVGGWIADHYPKRRVLQITQTAAAVLAAILAALTLTHQVTGWHVQLFAAGLGTVAAIEQPVRQAFLTDLVTRNQIRSAISLSYSVFYLGNFAGPAISGVLITAVGPGWAFALNAVAYVAPLTALARIDPDPIRPQHCSRSTISAPEELGTVLLRPEVWRPMVMCGAISMFSLNMPVILTTFARAADSGPAGYALLTSCLALGSVLGGIVSAGRTSTTLRTLTLTGYALAAVYALSALMPTLWSFACALVAIGTFSTHFFTASNTTVQLSAGRTLRGRVMSVYLLVFAGSAAIGGPLLGIIVQHLGARTSLLFAGLVPFSTFLLISLPHALNRSHRDPVR
ncbi:MFS transporter [Nocardia sp. NPDC059246]|uniref:MFS transporter n=1 Tax=unclassified Nocardia TaxID=2637762 RepID=UPI0036CBD3F0